MNDEQFFLANAYLDGELTADERRIAEADPEVMTEVEQLRALQAGVRDVPAPTAAARESAISAAMAAFDGSLGTDAAPAGDAPGHTGSPVVPFRPRPAYAKYLGIAAAFVAVAGLGIVLAQGAGGDDDSADTAADMPTDGAVERGDAMTEPADTADAADSELMITADDADDATADQAVEDEVAAEPEAGDMPETGPEATAESSSEDSSGGSPTSGGEQLREVPPDFDPRAPIADDVELGVYGVYLLAEREAERLPPTPNHSCVTFEQILDEAMLVVDGEPVRVYVDVRESDGQVVALRTDTCAELLRGSLFLD